jgi:hypothetical protein
MPFSLPAFNLLCNVYQGPWLGKVLRIADLPCNLAIGRRVQQLGTDQLGFPQGFASPSLLVPKGSDVRDTSQQTQPDILEVPSGSGRWYATNIVDDMAKGFSNEYRLVSMYKVCDAVNPALYPGLFWPIPMP